MKRIFIMAFMAVMCAASADAQVVFNKFKFYRNNPMGVWPTRKGTDIKFKVTSDKTIKYLDVRYSGVNRFGDAVSSDIVGAVNANTEHTKYRSTHSTGPYEPGMSYHQIVEVSFYHKDKDLVAFPRQIAITYQNGETEEIDITKENIGTFFPKIAWIDVNYQDGM